ncbi:MAG: hypothetical protein JO114_03100 [Planctomycetaceae bacterium]|nr:hypothetical protein [Planctomycetaceae bacterium]MBV8311989.1 hypothetical protein [Planctomycetaceae bacterium]
MGRGWLEGAVGPATIRLLKDGPETLYGRPHRMVANLLTALFCHQIVG